eukprot:6029244-Lingulodinium_polyedra.AAC.1
MSSGPGTPTPRDPTGVGSTSACSPSWPGCHVTGSRRWSRGREANAHWSGSGVPVAACCAS